MINKEAFVKLNEIAQCLMKANSLLKTIGCREGIIEISISDITLSNLNAISGMAPEGGFYFQKTANQKSQIVGIPLKSLNHWEITDLKGH